MTPCDLIGSCGNCPKISDRWFCQWCCGSQVPPEHPENIPGQGSPGTGIPNPLAERGRDLITRLQAQVNPDPILIVDLINVLQQAGQYHDAARIAQRLPSLIDVTHPQQVELLEHAFSLQATALQSLNRRKAANESRILAKHFTTLRLQR